HVRFDQEQQQFVRYGPALEWEPIQVARNRRAESQALLGWRDLGVATIEAQSGGHGEDEAEAARERLVIAWRDYEQRYGPINRSTEVWRQPPVSQQRKLVAELERQWRGDFLMMVRCHVTMWLSRNNCATSGYSKRPSRSLCGVNSRI